MCVEEVATCVYVEKAATCVYVEEAATCVYIEEAEIALKLTQTHLFPIWPLQPGTASAMENKEVSLNAQEDQCGQHWQMMSYYSIHPCHVIMYISYIYCTHLSGQY